MDIRRDKEVLFNDTKIRCVFTSTGINHFSGCSCVIAICSPRNTSVVQNILASGSSHFICLSKSLTYSTNATTEMNVNSPYESLRIYQTLSGHTSDIRCIRWLSCCCHQSSLSQVYQQSICFLMSADNSGTVIIWASSTDDIMYSDNLNNWYVVNKFQAPNHCIINSIDGYFLPSSKSLQLSDHSSSGWLFLSAAADTSVYNWSVCLPDDLLTSNEVLLPCTRGNQITRNPSLCLCLRSFCVKYSCVMASNENACGVNSWLHIIVLGLDNGQMEIWSGDLVSDQEDGTMKLNFILSTSVSGHEDWIRCIDVCVDQVSTIPIVLIATGGQDSIVRLWRLFSTVNDIIMIGCEPEKSIHLQLPEQFINKNIHLCLTSESVLASHENWVTGVRWAPTTNVQVFPPNLLTCSMDKSLIIWEPPSENSTESSDMCSLWKEKTRLGHFGDTGLSIMDCHWLPNDGTKVFGHTFQGSISIWFKSDKEFWLPALPLTGHVGPVADLSWMSTFPEEDITIDDCYTYLLTAGFDQTVRLYTCQLCNSDLKEEFWHELARPQIHGYDMNAIESISPTLYVSAGDEKVVRVFTTTKAFMNSFKRLYHSSSSIRTKLDRILADSSIPTGAVQPPLGLSNQIVTLSSNNNKANNEDGSDNNDEYVINEKNEDISGDCPSDELPTEDRLQHATLWPEVKKLYGHPYEIYCLAVHPHKLLVASACTASKPEYAHIILWNGDLNWCIHQRLQHHQLTVTQMAWSHDGTRLLAVSRDRTWSLWSEQSMSSTKEKEEIVVEIQLRNYVLSAYPMKGQSHSRIIWTCGWSPDDKYFFTGSRDSTICCWNGTCKTEMDIPVEGFCRLDTYKDCGHPVTALDVCSTVNLQNISTHPSYLMAVGLETGSIILLKLNESGSCERFFRWSVVLNFPRDWCHVVGKRLRRISFSPEVSSRSKDIRQSIIHLATAGDDGLVRVFKIDRSSI
ncbi:unnamed protein product [Heterobilharzia americana]|nr:unnamed protein product [Heterobilharzia americana]